MCCRGEGYPMYIGNTEDDMNTGLDYDQVSEVYRKEDTMENYDEGEIVDFDDYIDSVL